MNQPEILFVLPPSSGIGSFSPHLRTAYIAAFLNAHGIRAGKFVTSSPASTGTVASAILERKPRVVGLTAYEGNVAQTLGIAEALKGIAPDVVVLPGGPTPSVHAKTLLETCPAVDGCVRYDREETTLELMERLASSGCRGGRSKSAGALWMPRFGCD